MYFIRQYINKPWRKVKPYSSYEISRHKIELKIVSREKIFHTEKLETPPIAMLCWDLWKILIL